MNRKPLTGILIVVVLIVAYLGLSWATGHLARSQLQTWHEINAQKMPLFKLVDRKVEGGLFESVEMVTYELNTAIFGGLFEQARLHKAVTQEEEELPRFTLRNRIQHGPLPGFTGFGMARIESDLVLSDEMRARLKEHIDTDQPLVSVTELGFTGNGVMTLTGPAFETTLDGEDGTLSWGGVEGRIRFNRNLSRFAGEMSLPRVRIASAADGGELAFDGIRMDMDLELAFGQLGVGAVTLEMAELRGSGFNAEGQSMSMKGLRYEAKMDRKEDYLDAIAKFGLKGLRIDQAQMSDVHYDFSFLHLHGPTYAEFIERVQELYFSLGKHPTAPFAMVGLLAEYGPRLLEHDPVMVIDHVGFSVPEGEFGISGQMRLNEFEREDLAGGVVALLPKLEGQMNVWMSEALLDKDWSAFGKQPSDRQSAAANAQKAQALRAQFEVLEQQGYVKRNGERLESRLEWSAGGLAVNGHPLPLPGMGMPRPEPGRL